MIKPHYSNVLLVITFLALTIVLSSVRVYAGAIDKPGDSSTSSISNGSRSDVKDLQQPEAARLMAQAEARAEEGEHHCVRYCRHHYEERLAECSQPGHEHHHRCEEWARERERECLENCYREHPK